MKKKNKKFQLHRSWPDQSNEGFGSTETTYYWVTLVAGNGQVISTTETYTRKASALAFIRSENEARKAPLAVIDETVPYWKNHKMITDK